MRRRRASATSIERRSTRMSSSSGFGAPAVDETREDGDYDVDDVGGLDDDVVDDSAVDSTRARVDDDVAVEDAVTTTTTTTSASASTAGRSSRRRDARGVARDGAATALVVVGVLLLARKAWAWARGDDDERGHPGPGRDAGFHRAHRKCNRCGVRGKQVTVKCSRCKRCWYCSQACKKAAWAMEICECC